MTENNTTLYSSDKPAIVDKLGTEEQQRGLVGFMRHCSTPMTIAVQGDWGTGKTSMMRLLEKELKKENGSTLWFPTWQFAVLGEQDRLLMDLLMFICSKFEKRINEIEKKYKDEKIVITNEEQDIIDKIKDIKNKVVKFLKRVKDPVGIGFFYLLAEITKKMTNVDPSKTLGEIINTLKEQDKQESNSNNDEIKITYESYVMQVSELYDDLTELINAYLKLNKTNRLYIFIDDLDRLEPVRAVELLEGIKNFLDIDKCVFVLAIDTKVVIEGLKAKYAENMDKNKLSHYLDKIIQIPYKLPVHNYKLDAFMEDVLKGYDEKNLSKYLEFLKDTDIHNPRTIKRCVNFCLLHKYIDSKENGLSSDENFCLHLFVVKMLELEHEDEYSKLLTKARALGENYTDLKSWFLVNEDLKFDLFDKVLKSFEIDENAVDTKVKLFAEYIILSAPAKLIEEKQNVEEEQNVKDFRGADLRGEILSGENLRGENLGAADLSGADLREADLSEADLSEANLSGADLLKANLHFANLDCANLHGAYLQKAFLNAASLRDANLQEARLSGASLKRTNLSGAHLTYANLIHAHLTGAKLSVANLREAFLNGADLSLADLRGADLRGADLSLADLRGADLRGADLSGANLSLAKLIEADLRGACLYGADLDGAELNGAKYCRDSQFETIFPDGFNPEEHGMIEVDHLGKEIKQTVTDEQSETQPIAPL